MGYRKAAEVGLLPAAQLSTAQYLDLCLMVLSLVAGEKGGDKVDGDLLSCYCKPDNS